MPGLIGIHHVHVWSMTGEKPTISLHATVSDGAAHSEVIATVHARLAGQLGCEHTTVQVEEEGICNTPDCVPEPH